MADLEELLKHLDSPAELVGDAVDSILADLREQEFFGTVELKFEAGRVVLLRKTETIRPKHYRNNRGDNRGHQG